MAIDFPNSPATNATYTVGNKTWIYDGTTWNTYNTTSFSAETLPGTTLKSTVTGSSLTNVGTLTSLNVTGDLTVDTSTLKVDSTNNRVGVGTTSPSATLDVQASTGTAMRITNTGTGDSFLVEDAASTDTTPFVIDRFGSVGIGTGSPGYMLDVVGSARIGADLIVDTNTLYVDSFNNCVGIGTASPQATLDIQHTGVSTAMRITNTGTGESFRVEDASGDTTPFVINADGAVGIGTSSPAAKLDVQVSSGNAMRITNSGSGESFRVEDATGDTTPFVIDAAGNVGMGVTFPAARLHISDGNANIRLNTSTLSADALNIVAPVAGANNRSLTIRPVMNMSASNTLELPNTTGELAAFTSARGTNTAWTTFTSTITQSGNVTFNTQLSRYCQIGKLIHWQFSLACTGTGTINNAIRINLPQTAQGNAIYSAFGTMHVYDASANTHYTGHAFAYSTTQAAMMLNAGTTYFQAIALTTNDIISGHIIYEAA